MKLWIAVFGVPVAILVLRMLATRQFGYPGSSDAPHPTNDELVLNVPVLPEMRVHLDRFIAEELSLVKVVEGVHVAVGTAFANTIIIDAPEGLIVVDTTENKETAAETYRKLRQITDKPIKAIIYTHCHGDHTQGTESFIEDAAVRPDIWGFHKMKSIIDADLTSSIRTGYGAAYQFGIALGSGRVAPKLPYGLSRIYPLLPNKLIRNEIEHVNIAGQNVTFLHIPSETDDHIAVWLEDRKVLLSGDSIYPSFPNAYAIRGTPARDLLQWVESLNKIRALQPEHLIPGHCHPMSGREEIDKLLAVYAAAIQYVHDQTVRRMNELRHPDEIAQMVRLPPDLATNPHLADVYGKVEWSSKAVYQRYVGWFSGDPVDLHPLLPTERSQRLVEMFGADGFLDEAESSLKAGDTQWALELSSHVFRVHPDNRRAKDIRVQALRTLAAEQINIGARNYYLTAALSTFGQLKPKSDPSSIIERVDIKVLLDMLKVRLKTELTHGVDETMFLQCEDSNRTFSLHVEYSVLKVEEMTGTDNTKTKDGEDSLLVTTTERVWKAVMFGLLPPATAYNQGDLKVTPANRLDDLRLFLSYF